MPPNDTVKMVNGADPNVTGDWVYTVWNIPT